MPDLDADPRTRVATWFRDHGLRSAIAVPILHGDTAIGVLGIASKTAFAGRPEDDTLLQSFVDQAAIAISHARLYAAGQARIQRLHTVTRLNRIVSSSLDLDHVLHEITVAAAQLAGTAAAGFWVAGPDDANPAAGRVLRPDDGGGLAGAEPALRRGRARVGRPLWPRR